MKSKNLIDNPVLALESLKRQLDKGKVSLLVGSGFSKNISEKFPTWSELLYDMVYEMYKPEIEFQVNARDNKKLKATQDRTTKIQQLIEEIIKREGYLELVSQYIKQKGFRESIDAYIEEHIPNIQRDESSEAYRLQFLHSAKEHDHILLPLNILDLHKKLIAQKWNNIFTTNYDNAIECSYEDKKVIVERMEQQINQINMLIEKNLEQIHLLQPEYVEAKEILSNIEVKEFNSFDSESIISPHSYSIKKDVEIKEKIETLSIENEKLAAEVNLLRSKIDNESINIVKDSSELEIQKNRNIIKLHGSIPINKDEKTFGFDGDIHKRYVIDKKDYQEYPKKHEAFTQLMRITLLQDSFCLIGFSGIDPNFIAWINWVRDIIERKPYPTRKNHSEDTGSCFKIYLIDIGNEKLTTEKEMYFKNHRIISIPLGSEEIIEYFKITSPNQQSGKNVLDRFLNYLSESTEKFIENERVKSYKVIWEELSQSIFGNIKNEPKLIENIERLWELKAYSRINVLDIYRQNVSTDFIRYIERIYTNFESLGILTYFYKLLILALNDSYLLFSPTIIPTRIFEQIKLNIPEEYSQKINLLEFRNAILSSDSEKNIYKSNSISNTLIEDGLKYEQALNYAFNFNFSGLSSHLNDWTPKSYFVVLKASLLAQLHPQEAYYLLEKFVNDLPSFSKLSYQEKINAYSILLVTKSSVRWEMDEKIHDKIDELKELGAKEIQHNIEIITKKINDKKDNKIRPYSRGEFDFYHDMTGDKMSLLGIQFMQYLIQSGLPLEVKNARVIENKDWFSAFTLIYEEYPLPALFYSLQYQDGNFTKRIGQDFVNSEKLKDKLSTIYQTLSKAYFCVETHEKIRGSILYFLSEIVAAIPSQEWEKTFIMFWNSFLKDDLQFSDTAFHVHRFINTSLGYLTTNETIEYIIDSLIDNRNKGNLVIDYLYYLSNSKRIKQTKAYLHHSSLPKKINIIIDEIDGQFTNSMYLLGNLEQLVNSEQRTKIEAKLNNINLLNFDNYNIWNIVVHFSKNNKTIRKNVKAAILKSKYLFNSGIRIDDDHRLSASDESFIELHNLRKNDFRINGLIWTKNEILILYNVLQNELEKIEKWGNREWRFLRLNDLLDEMKDFLIDEKNTLEKQPSYQEISRKIEILLTNGKGKGGILERLMADHEEYYFHALADLTNYLFDNLKISPYHDCIEFILSKVLAMAEPNILFTLKTVATWVKVLKDDNCMNVYCEKLCLILERYKANDYLNCYKPAYYQHLTTIALVLDYWKVNNIAINYWLSQKISSQYNNVRQLKV